MKCERRGERREAAGGLAGELDLFRYDVKNVICQQSTAPMKDQQLSECVSESPAAIMCSTTSAAAKRNKSSKPIDNSVAIRKSTRARTTISDAPKHIPGGWKWTDDEDRILSEAMAVYNMEDRDHSKPSLNDLFAEVARILGTDPQRVKSRWVNHLDPKINHGPMSRTDDLCLWEGYKRYGNQWVSTHKSVEEYSS